MVDSIQIIRMIRQAALLSRATKGRRGLQVLLPETAEVLVAGDLHGHFPNFRAIVDYADLDHHPQRHLVLQEFVHGANRFPDGGGCTSCQLLEAVAALKVKYADRVHLLLGNHEMSEWTQRSIIKKGVVVNVEFAQGVRTRHGGAAEQVLQTYKELYASLLLAVRTPGGVLMTHSIPSAKALESFRAESLDAYGIPEPARAPGSDYYHLIWDRDTRQETADRFAERMGVSQLVTGHIVCEGGYALPNSRQLILDCSGDSPHGLLAAADRTYTQAELLEGLVNFRPSPDRTSEAE